MLTGTLIRKKYEIKLTNMKNKSNLNNNENNKIEVLKDIEKKSILIQKILTGYLLILFLLSF